MPKAEKKVVEVIKSNIFIIALFALIMLSLLIRLSGFSFVTSDCKDFRNWVNQSGSYGGLSALKYSIGNYNISYMFILALLSYLPINPVFSIKTVSIIFDYIGAWAAGLIVYALLKETDKNRAKFLALLTFCIVIFLPTVIFNSSFWAQCDMIYSSFVLLCIFYMIKEKYTMSIIFFSIAFAFKLQAIFIFPLLLIMYFVKNKFSIFKMFIIPAIYLVSILPALIAARGFKDIMKIYFSQTNLFKSLTCNYPNLYTFINGKYSDFVYFGLFLTVAILGVLLMILIYKKWDVRNDNIVSLSILVIYICLFFLPAMHERYGFLLDILSIVYFMVKRKKIYIPIAVNFVSLLSYMNYLLQKSLFDMKFLALLNLVILAVVTFDVLTDIKKDNEKMNGISAESNVSALSAESAK